MAENTVTPSSGVYESRSFEREDRQTLDVVQSTGRAWQIIYLCGGHRRKCTVSRHNLEMLISRKEASLRLAEGDEEGAARFSYDLADLRWKLAQLEAHGG